MIFDATFYMQISLSVSEIHNNKATIWCCHTATCPHTRTPRRSLSLRHRSPTPCASSIHRTRCNWTPSAPPAVRPRTHRIRYRWTPSAPPAIWPHIHRIRCTWTPSAPPVHTVRIHRTRCNWAPSAPVAWQRTHRNHPWRTHTQALAMPAVPGSTHPKPTCHRPPLPLAPSANRTTNCVHCHTHKHTRAYTTHSNSCMCNKHCHMSFSNINSQSSIINHGRSFSRTICRQRRLCPVHSIIHCRILISCRHTASNRPACWTRTCPALSFWGVNVLCKRVKCYIR